MLVIFFNIKQRHKKSRWNHIKIIAEKLQVVSTTKNATEVKIHELNENVAVKKVKEVASREFQYYEQKLDDSNHRRKNPKSKIGFVTNKNDVLRVVLKTGMKKINFWRAQKSY